MAHVGGLGATDHTCGMADFRLLTSLTEVHAAIVKGALEAEGITVVLDGPGLSSVYPLNTGTWASRVMVPADQWDEAQRILASFEDPAG